jgi:hypothetical protein
MCSFCVIFCFQFENLFSKLVKMPLKSNWIFRRALIVRKSPRFVYFYLTKIYSLRNLKYRARYHGGSSNPMVIYSPLWVQFCVKSGWRDVSDARRRAFVRPRCMKIACQALRSYLFRVTEARDYCS